MWCASCQNSRPQPQEAVTIAMALSMRSSLKKKKAIFHSEALKYLEWCRTWSASNVNILLKVSLRKTQEDSFSGKWQKGYSEYTDIFTLEYYWFNYHELSMTVLERSTRVAISVFLAVNNATLHCFLNLKCHINRVKNLTEITHWNFISPTGQKISHSQ